jgi:hypothetical protein
MNIYLDDDSASPLLATLLRNAGHDAVLPSDVGTGGEPDAVHLTHAIRDGRACLTKDRRDYWILHTLLMTAQGHHPGIIVVRQETNLRAIFPRRASSTRFANSRRPAAQSPMGTSS